MTNNCSVCGKQSYMRMCDNCLREFDWSAYADYFTRATYSPEDDKVRLYVSGRLPAPLYDALLSVGFQHAPQQGWYGQTWTPLREDIALELCDEIEDEDVTNEERALMRQARFATYADNAARRARAAAVAGAEIQKWIPLGQPILVGHHSEKRARRDLERIQHLAVKAADEFDRSTYWSDRSERVLAHAAHREGREAIMRRIKRLESELRKYVKSRMALEAASACWQAVTDQSSAIRAAQVHPITGYFPPEKYPWSRYEWWQSYYSALMQGLDWQEARERVLEAYWRSIEWDNRYIEHLEGQISYWKALLQEKHSEDIDSQIEIKVGDWVRMTCYGNHYWGKVVRVNRSPATKRITTVTVTEATRQYYTDKWLYESIKEVLHKRPTQAQILGESATTTSPAPDPEVKQGSLW